MSTPGPFDPPGPYQPPPGYSPPGYSPPGPYQPPPAYPPPGYGPQGYAVGEPPRKRKVWPWVVGVLFVVLLLIGGCSVWLFSEVKRPVDATNQFMAAVQAADWSTVMDLTDTSGRCFGESARRDLEEFFAGWTIEDYSFLSSSLVTSGGETTAQVDGTLETDRGRRGATVYLVENDDGWRVCGLDI